MLPPPAPTSAMSIVGIRSSSPAPRISRLPAEIEPPTSYSRPRAMAPSSISDAFAVVPPMSKAIALSMPSRCAIPSAATTPAAGPDSSANTGRSFASSAVITPPEDCMIESGARRARSPSSPVRIRSMYDDISGRTYALTTVVADRSYSRCSRRISLESEIVGAGSSSAQDRADPPLVLRVEVGVQEAHRDGVDAELAQAGGERAHLGLVERPHHGAVGGHPLGHLEAQAPLDERRRLAPEEVVHVRERGGAAARGRRGSPAS